MVCISSWSDIVHIVTQFCVSLHSRGWQEYDVENFDGWWASFGRTGDSWWFRYFWAARTGTRLMRLIFNNYGKWVNIYYFALIKFDAGSSADGILVCVIVLSYTYVFRYSSFIYTYCTYCHSPQFDALHEFMSAKEHLEFYGRIRVCVVLLMKFYWLIQM